MRIAIVAPYPIGQIDPGLEKYIRPNTWTENLAKALLNFDDDIEVHIVSGISPRIRNVPRYINKDNIHFHFFLTSGRFSHYFFYAYEILKTRKILGKIQPDIVHGQGLEGPSGLAAIFSGYANVVTVHGILNEFFKDSPRDQFLSKFLERVGLKLAKNFIIINPYVIDILKAYNKTSLTTKKMFNIPNSVSHHFFYGNGKKKKKQEISIIYCGGIIPRKRLIDLLKALKELENRNCYFKLCITGFIIRSNEVKSYANKVKKFVKENIKSDVEFTGFVNPSDMPSLLRKMDMLILPSSAETAPMVIAEAMASGIPVVACDVGGVKHMIKDGSTGFLVKVGDVKELADKIEILLTDKDLRDRMGCKAREEARRRYHPDVIAKKTIDAYREILKGHNMEMK